MRVRGVTGRGEGGAPDERTCVWRSEPVGLRFCGCCAGTPALAAETSRLAGSAWRPRSNGVEMSAGRLTLGGNGSRMTSTSADGRGSHYGGAGQHQHDTSRRMERPRATLHRSSHFRQPSTCRQAPLAPLAGHADAIAEPTKLGKIADLVSPSSEAAVIRGDDTHSLRVCWALPTTPSPRQRRRGPQSYVPASVILPGGTRVLLRSRGGGEVRPG